MKEWRLRDRTRRTYFYLRTRSQAISEEADKAAREYIDKAYGEKYLQKPFLSKDKEKRRYRMHMKPSDLAPHRTFCLLS